VAAAAAAASAATRLGCLFQRFLILGNQPQISRHYCNVGLIMGSLQDFDKFLTMSCAALNLT
jgi:hypothetical protein